MKKGDITLYLYVKHMFFFYDPAGLSKNVRPLRRNDKQSEINFWEDAPSQTLGVKNQKKKNICFSIFSQEKLNDFLPTLYQRCQIHPPTKLRRFWKTFLAISCQRSVSEKCALGAAGWEALLTTPSRADKFKKICAPPIPPESI